MSQSLYPTCAPLETDHASPQLVCCGFQSPALRVLEYSSFVAPPTLCQRHRLYAAITSPCWLRIDPHLALLCRRHAAWPAPQQSGGRPQNVVSPNGVVQVEFSKWPPDLARQIHPPWQEMSLAIYVPLRWPSLSYIPYSQPLPFDTTNTFRLGQNAPAVPQCRLFVRHAHCRLSLGNPHFESGVFNFNSSSSAPFMLAAPAMNTAARFGVFLRGKRQNFPE